ncbi:MAG: DNA repair protein RadC [Bacteroidales bacterium]|nr:DNA repair protein RadC [Bacteroidales bacterium]
MKYLSIKEWASDDRPREKLLNKGVNSLSDAELLAILIRSGTKEISAVELSRTILTKCGNKLSELSRQSVAQLKRIKGIGEAKAISIVAAIELGRRRNASEVTEKQQLTSSKDAYKYFHSLMSDLSHEEFWILFLNRSNKIIESYKLSQGGISGTVIDNRLILKKAIDVLASALVIGHNHPSGNLQPSENDNQITDKLKTALSHLDIKLLDHIIIGDNSYFSYSDEGLL